MTETPQLEPEPLPEGGPDIDPGLADDDQTEQPEPATDTMVPDGS